MELKPCPFCGGEPSARSVHVDVDKSDPDKPLIEFKYVIMCLSCLCARAEGRTVFEVKGNDLLMLQNGKEIAAEKWNRRT